MPSSGRLPGSSISLLAVKKSVVPTGCLSECWAVLSVARRTEARRRQISGFVWRRSLEWRWRWQIVTLVLDWDCDIAGSVDAAPYTTSHLRMFAVDGVATTAIAHDSGVANEGKREVPGWGNDFGQTAIDKSS
jgi:hypothetical protein